MMGYWAQLGIIWLIVVGVLSYLVWIIRARNQATSDMMEPPEEDGLSDTELERYARHIVLREIGGPGQMTLRESRVLVVGAGGLGCPVLLYLAAAGIGRIGIIDDDVVSLSNLQRQVLFTEDDLGKPKVFAAKDRLLALNPHVDIRPYHRRFSPEIGADLAAEYDLVIDGTDQFATRFAVNQACVAAAVPLLSGAIAQWEGQIGLFDPKSGGPCYACLFDQAPADGLAPSCAEAGVLGALPGVVGATLAAEAIKLLTKAGSSPLGTLQIIDMLYGENRRVKIVKRKGCKTCDSPLAS